MKIIPFKAIHPQFDMVKFQDRFFDTMKYDYVKLDKKGFFKKRKHAGFYIYRITTDKRIQTGLVVTLDIKDILKNKLKKHEKTIAQKEKRLSYLLLERKAMIKPILVGYPKISDRLDDYIEKIIKSRNAYIDITLGNGIERHQFWQVKKLKRIKKIKELFKSTIPFSYIADGHHRCATMVKLYNTQKIKSTNNHQTVLAAFFSFKDLKIHGFNRVIDIFYDINPKDFKHQLSKYCKIKSIKIKKFTTKKSKLGKHKFHVCITGKWYELKWKKSLLKQFEKKKMINDIDLFNHFVLKKALKVTNIREDKRISYVDGNLGYEGVENKVRNNDHLIGFCFKPIKSKEIMRIADANDELPPKSSFFEPRIKNGLILKKYKTIKTENS